MIVFSGGSVDDFFVTGSSFVLPEEFTLEFWMFPRSDTGYVLSWAVYGNDNCMLLQNSAVTVFNQWHHIAIVVGKDRSGRCLSASLSLSLCLSVSLSLI